MSELRDEIQKEIRTNLDALTELRDEIRVKIHLAGMDAKDAWNRLEPKVHEVEAAAAEVSETARHALHDVVQRMRELRTKL